ncbi:MAG: hypothetical protein WAN22_19075 [Solirubrobacteraceae bacterium]
MNRDPDGVSAPAAVLGFVVVAGVAGAGVFLERGLNSAPRPA